MTREEKQTVLHCLKSMIDEEVCEECPLYGTTGTDHCEKDCVRLAINALEQVPCTDAISRQVAIDGADAIIARDTSGNNDVVKAMTAWKSYVEGLPSVTPAEKIGRWVYNKNLSTHYGDVYTCSECGERCLESCYDHIDKLPNFCPKCHTKMEVNINA